MSKKQKKRGCIATLIMLPFDLLGAILKPSKTNLHKKQINGAFEAKRKTELETRRRQRRSGRRK